MGNFENLQTRALGEIVKELTKINRNLGKLTPKSAPIPSTTRRGEVVRTIPSTTRRGEVVRTIPLDIDIVTPAVHTTALFIKNEDGTLTIGINVEGEDASIVEDLLDSLPVTRLSLEAF